MLNLDSLEKILQRYYQCKELNVESEAVSGGDIHHSFVISLSLDYSVLNSQIPKQIFLKVNSGVGADVLKSEYESLKIINEYLPKFYPQVIFFERVDTQSLLAMNYHLLSPIMTMNATEAGRALAKHHKITNDQFGWPTDNYIGFTPQLNEWNSNWVSFFREQRLTPIIDLAANAGLPTLMLDQSRQVVNILDQLLCHEVSPSLVHGDLWSGNLGIDKKKQQTLFYDPAPYYGDREVDLAMSQLFGSQPEPFYQAYQEECPLANGYEKRMSVYNLYHALNHVVLFGSSYFRLVENCLDQITISYY